MWTILFTKQAEKDKSLLKQAKLDNKAKNLLNIMAVDPFHVPPSYEKLVGDLNGYYSRRINFQHRIVYRVDKEKRVVIIHAMWTHYE